MHLRMNRMDNRRSDVIDIVKGILITLVVIGHYEKGAVLDIVFFFQLPPF